MDWPSLFQGDFALLHLRTGLRIEEIGGEAIVIDAARNESHQVSGEGLEALRLLEVGVAEPEVPQHLQGAVDELIATGLVEDSTRWTRRKMLLAGGATLAAATVTSFVLADPAAAASNCAQGATSKGTFDTPGSFAFTVNNSDTMLTVQLWGAGGGGGANNGGTTGSGGGGGGYATAVVTVVPCTTYIYQVGDGGDGGQGNDPSNSANESTYSNTNHGIPGGRSSFGTSPGTASGPTQVWFFATGGRGGWRGVNADATTSTGGGGFVGSGGTLGSPVYRTGGTGGRDANASGGGGGGSGGTTANGNNGNPSPGSGSPGPGATAVTGGGGGGNGGTSGGNGSGGGAPGGGGGGSAVGNPFGKGGDGANGRVVIS